MTRENSLHQGAYPRVANLNHAPCLRDTCAHKATQGIVRLRIPSRVGDYLRIKWNNVLKPTHEPMIELI